MDDIASDMSVFHRISDITVLNGPTLFRLAWRLPAYEGAMRLRVMEARDVEPETPASAHSAGGGAAWNPGTKATLMADPALAGVFSFG